MRTVLFLDVRPNLNPLRPDATAIPEQFGGGGLNQSFVRYVRKCEAFGANEIQTGGVRDRERLGVGRRKNLDAARKFAGLLDLSRNDGHRRDDFRPDATSEIRRVVHVFEYQSVDAG